MPVAKHADAIRLRCSPRLGRLPQRKPVPQEGRWSLAPFRFNQNGRGFRRSPLGQQLRARQALRAARGCACRRLRQAQEKRQIDRMIDIHRDPGLADHRRLDALQTRGVEVREVAVIAEAKRHRFRRRADHGIGSEIVMRRRDRERRARRDAPIAPRRSRPARVAGMSAGHRDHAAASFAREKAAARVHAAGMSIPRPRSRSARRSSLPSAVACGSRVTIINAGQKPGAGHRIEHVRRAWCRREAGVAAATAGPTADAWRHRTP